MNLEPAQPSARNVLTGNLKFQTMTETITWPDFAKIEMRVGTIIRVDDFPEASNPAYQIFVEPHLPTVPKYRDLQAPTSNPAYINL